MRKNDNYSRREFLGVAGAATLSSALPKWAGAQNELRRYDAAAVRGVLERVLGKHAMQIQSRYKESESDSFSIFSKNKSIVVEGSSSSAILAGVSWYLKYVAGVSISWNGDCLSLLLPVLPQPAAPMHQHATVAHRFALNDTNDGYTGPYWTWERWESLIDVLALHGINEVLLYQGAEAVYQRTLRQFGYSEDELRSWFPTPAHQPWWLLQNQSGWVGPTVSQRLIDTRLALAVKICERLRSLGIVPVFPGYYGMVPEGFASRNPGARIQKQGSWLGMRRPDWLDPTCDVFPKIAAAYYKAQRELLGPSTMFKMDPMHEGGNAGSIDVTAAARSIDEQLQRANPGATWVILGWIHNPLPELLAGIKDKSRMLILDGVTDRYDHLNREEQWNHIPYAFGTIWNYGGHTAIGANLGVWNERFYQMLGKPDSTLCGIAVLPEQSCNNPAAFEFFTELAWRPTPVDTVEWFRDWSVWRYGGVSEGAARAWEIIRKTAYSGTSGEFGESHDNLFSAQPDLSANKACSWAPAQPRYDLAVFAQAIAQLLQVPPSLRGTSAYRYDLVDVARQTISDESRVLLPLIKAAYEEKKREEFRTLTASWARRCRALEQVAGTDSAFMLGPWLAAAHNAAGTLEERRQFNFDARSILVQWGPASSRSSQVRDYSNRDWNGLLSFYRKRWQAYFASLEEAWDSRSPKKIDWFAMDEEWSHQNEELKQLPDADFYGIIQAALQGALKVR